MPICQMPDCINEFPLRIEIDGKVRNLQGRKYCLECSPFGKHNTKKLNGESRADQGPYRCKCGETDPDNFYGNKRSFCAKCHNEYTIRIGQEKRQRAIDHLGGKCVKCDYDRYIGSIDLHHLDPTKKDVNFKNIKGWKWERILKEIENCVLLCKNCHQEVHAGITSI